MAPRRSYGQILAGAVFRWKQLNNTDAQPTGEMRGR